MQIVLEPKKTSEFEIQAMLWAELRAMGYNVRGEVRTPFTGGMKRERCRFDLAIFEDGKMVGIIETKAGVTKHKTDAGWHGTRQGFRYSTFGVPMVVIYGQNHAEKFLDATRSLGAIDWLSVPTAQQNSELERKKR